MSTQLSRPKTLRDAIRVVEGAAARGGIQEFTAQFFSTLAENIENDLLLLRHSESNHGTFEARLVLAQKLVAAAAFIQEGQYNLNPTTSALASESVGLVNEGHPAEVLLFPAAVEPGPYTIVLTRPANVEMALLIFDCQMHSVIRGASNSVLHHEISHGHPQIDQLWWSMNPVHHRIGEILADMSALALAGAPFPAHLRDFFEAVQYPPTRATASHPSLLTRLTALRFQAPNMWSGPYLSEVLSAIGPSSLAESEDGQKDFIAALDRIPQLRHSLASVQIQDAWIYEARARGSSRSPRVKVAAGHAPT